jgi:predicted ATPase
MAAAPAAAPPAAHGLDDALLPSCVPALVLQVGGDRAGVKFGVDLTGGHGIPDTLEGLITQRIDKLDPTAQLTLKVASVVGRAFGEKVVNAVFPVDALRGELRPYLTMLAEDGLTREASTPASAA